MAVLSNIFWSVFPAINLGVVLVIVVCSIYALILFIKLAKKGIKALDIYIDNNKK